MGTLNGYLYSKKTREVIMLIEDVVTRTDNEVISSSGAAIEGLPKESDELAGFILSYEVFKREDVLPVDIKAETLEPAPSTTDARVKTLEEQLEKTKQELATARQENSSTMIALTTLFELLIPGPTPTEEGTTEEV